jgi:hypothetical protein
MGLAAQKLGFCRNSAIVIGVGIAAKAKNEPSDPALDYHLINLERGIDTIRGNVSQLGIRPTTGSDYRLGDPSGKK